MYLRKTASPSAIKNIVLFFVAGGLGFQPLSWASRFRDSRGLKFSVSALSLPNPLGSSQHQVLVNPHPIRGENAVAP